MTVVPFVYAVDKTHNKKTSSVLSSVLREFVSLTAAENALSPCSKIFGVSGGTHIVLLRSNQCLVGSSWNLEE